MQGDRSIMDSCPETIDLNQGSLSSTASVEPMVPWDNLLDPLEDRLSNSMFTSARENPTGANVGRCNTQNCSGWEQGDSSFSANLHEHGHGSDLKIGHSWPSSSNDYAMTNPKSEERRFEPCNVFLPESSTSGYGGTRLIGSRPSLPNLSSAHTPGNASGVYNHGDTRLVMGPSASPMIYTSNSRWEAERPASGVSYHVGASSGSSSHWAGAPDISGSSVGNWGLSCKRKALEGSSVQSCAGSSSSNAEPENIIQYNFPSRHNVSSSLNISPAAATVQNAGYLENLYPRNGVGTRVAASDTYPPLSDSRIVETPGRNFGVGVNLGNQDTVAFGLPPTGTDLGHSSFSSIVHPRPISVTSSLGSRQPISQPMSSGNSGSHADVVQVSGVPGGLHPVPWNVSPNSRGGSSSSPNMVSGDRYAAVQGEASFRNSTRNSWEPHPFVPTPETRNMVQDPTNWSLATSNVSHSRNLPSSSALGQGLSAQTSPTPWLLNQNSATSSRRSFSEFDPWTLLPPVESDSGSQRGHFSLLSSAASSLEEAEMSSRSTIRGSSSRRNHQLRLRSNSIADFPGNDMDGWRGLAADIEGRHRLIRQVLHAMRRVENMRSEDYMLLDPFNGAAELHDRHRHMRLDVDNMSYEELLALEERIGNVNTGLSEETILGHMKQRKHETMYGGSSSNLEPCCICREEYTTGDDMGTLACGHEFHSNCIKQWLMLKNLCPICKMTALET